MHSYPLPQAQTYPKTATRKGLTKAVKAPSRFRLLRRLRKLDDRFGLALLTLVLGYFLSHFMLAWLTTLP